MSGNSIVLYQQKKTAPRMAAVDNMNEVVDPINYSFCGIESIDEIKEEEPRPSPRKEKAQPASSGKSKSKGLRLNNNSLANLDKLRAALEACFQHPTEIEWMDLSMNDLTDIPDTLLECENLKILYLHGNQIRDMKEIEKLNRLKYLTKLTLHGNPVETDGKDHNAYRSSVLSYLPNLKCLDFSLVTKGDRRTSNTLCSFNKNKRIKKKNMDDED